MRDQALSRIMLVSRNFPPLRGGMERLNYHLLAELSKAYDVTLVGPGGAEDHASCARSVITCPSSHIHVFLACAIVRSVIAARSLRPSLILAGSGVNALPAWLAAGLNNVKWGIYLHGLDIVVKNRFYQWCIMPVIRKADFWLVNSRATRAVAVNAGLDPDRIYLLNPGVSFPEQLSGTDAVFDWRRVIDSVSGPILLSVGRLTRRKGLLEFILHSFPGILKDVPDALLVVVGPEPVDALQKNTVGITALQLAAREVGAEKNIRFLGNIDDHELALAYQAASVHVFPVVEIEGDMEGFGMVALEAAAYGLPTVAFNVGGVSDAVRAGESGELVRPGNYREFSDIVLNYLKSDNHKVIAERCRVFAQEYSWNNFGNALRQCPAIKESGS